MRVRWSAILAVTAAGMVGSIRPAGSRSASRRELRTALGCVRSVVTDLAWIDVDGEGFLLRQLAPGVTIDDAKQATAAPLRAAPDVCEMRFD